MNVEWLHGLICTRVSELQEHVALFEFGATTLAVECLWRVSVTGRLVVTSFDHNQMFGLPAPVDAFAKAHAELVGRSIASVRLDVQRGDLTLVLENDRLLEIITESSGYESWHLRAPGIYLASTSGGTVESLAPPQ